MTPEHKSYQLHKSIKADHFVSTWPNPPLPRHPPPTADSVWLWNRNKRCCRRKKKRKIKCTLLVRRDFSSFKTRCYLVRPVSCSTAKRALSWQKYLRQIQHLWHWYILRVKLEFRQHTQSSCTSTQLLTSTIIFMNISNDTPWLCRRAPKETKCTVLCYVTFSTTASYLCVLLSAKKRTLYYLSTCKVYLN